MSLDVEFKVWEGVYPRFSEAPVAGPGFSGPIWRERSLRAAREALSALNSGEPLDYALRQRNAPLPIVSALLLSRKSHIRILDFGGGLGTGFIVLAKALQAEARRVSYCVIELENICADGRDLLCGDKNVTFLSGPPSEGTFDLVYSASALQYSDDWKAMVVRLAAYQSPFIVFADCFVGEFESFATSQNYYGSRIPHWFLNRAELEGVLVGEGYSLAMRADCDARILGRYGQLPMSNFPPDLRLKHSSHLLFTRSESREAP